MRFFMPVLLLLLFPVTGCIQQPEDGPAQPALPSSGGDASAPAHNAAQTGGAAVPENPPPLQPGASGTGPANGTGPPAQSGQANGAAAPATGRGIWMPRPGSTFQWQLSGALDSSVEADVYDIDLFDNSRETIDLLHGKGRRVICYFSAGSWEDWRPDSMDFPAPMLGRKYEGWEGERYLDIRRMDVLGPIIMKRLDLAKGKGCDAIEPDNIDTYDADTGFPLSYEDQIEFNLWLANETHARNMSIGLKNDPAQAADLHSHFDWALTEDCYAEGWCDSVGIFVASGKSVFQVEYTDTEVRPDEFCAYAAENNYTAIYKRRGLDAWRETCG